MVGRAQGTAGGFLLEINCKERVQIIWQISPHSRGVGGGNFFQGLLKPNLLKKGGLGWRHTTLGWVRGLGKQSKEETARSGLEGPRGGEGCARVVQSCQRRVKARSCSLGSSVPGKQREQGKNPLSSWYAAGR